MAENGTLAGTFVEPRGTISSTIASATENVLGSAGRMVGAAVGGAADQAMSGSSPLNPGGIAYLGVTADAVILFRAKRGAFSPKATAEPIASAPRGATQSASIADGRFGSGALSIVFVDGNTWTFDIPRVHMKGAREIVAALTPAGS